MGVSFGVKLVVVGKLRRVGTAHRGIAILLSDSWWAVPTLRILFRLQRLAIGQEFAQRTGLALRFLLAAKLLAEPNQQGMEFIVKGHVLRRFPARQILLKVFLDACDFRSLGRCFGPNRKHASGVVSARTASVRFPTDIVQSRKLRLTSVARMLAFC